MAIASLRSRVDPWALRCEGSSASHCCPPSRGRAHLRRSADRVNASMPASATSLHSLRTGLETPSCRAGQRSAHSELIILWLMRFATSASVCRAFLGRSQRQFARSVASSHRHCPASTPAWWRPIPVSAHTVTSAAKVNRVDAPVIQHALEHRGRTWVSG